MSPPSPSRPSSRPPPRSRAPRRVWRQLLAVNRICRNSVAAWETHRSWYERSIPTARWTRSPQRSWPPSGSGLNREKLNVGVGSWSRDEPGWPRSAASPSEPPGPSPPSSRFPAAVSCPPARSRRSGCSRPLDVEACLASRTYGGAPGWLSIDIVDDFLGRGGRFALEIDDSGHAACSRHRGDVDLTLSISDLGATIAGGVSLQTLAEAGRIDEHRPGSVQRYDRAFVTAVPPWCHVWF